MAPFPIDPDKDTICDVVQRWAGLQPEAPAFLAGETPPLTYGALAAAMDDIGRAISVSGFGNGDRIALAHPGGLGIVPLILGVIDRTAVVPLNPNLTVPEFAASMRQRRADALILDPGIGDAAREAAEELAIPILPISVDDSGMPLRSSNGRRRPARRSDEGSARPGDTALVLATSGTTSDRKVIPFSHRIGLVRALAENRMFGRTPQDVCVCPQPLHYAHGINQIMSSLASGGALALVPSLDGEAFLRAIARFAATCVWASVPFLHQLHETIAGREGRPMVHRLRYIRATSGYLDPVVADDLEASLGVPVVETYSSSETCRICCNPLPPGRRKRGTVGPPADGCDVRIRSPDGAFLGPGQRGEVVVRGDRVIDGYDGGTEADAEAFVDGWFRTGDEGYFDEDGYLVLTGRIKEMINRGGEKVSPAEVDAALMSHPAVADAATFAVPHPTLGEEVAAAVVRKRGAAVTDRDLTDYLLGRFSGFKVPKHFEFLDAIPRSDVGRVHRQALAESLGLTSVGRRHGHAESPRP